MVNKRDEIKSLLPFDVRVLMLLRLKELFLIVNELVDLIHHDTNNFK